MEDHLGAVGLGHKVGGAVGQGGNLILIAAALGGHHHRNQGQLPISANPIQEGIAVHLRHHHIQENEGDAALVRLQQLQRRLTVLRLQNQVFLRQNLAEDRPVELIVLNHQYPFFLHHFSSLFQLPGSEAGAMGCGSNKSNPR